MATLNQIKVNTGTEDSPTYVLHDVHDKRLDDGASSLVTTCTHLLATNAALSSFNPITSANLASVLGASVHEVSSSSASYHDDVATYVMSLGHGFHNFFIGRGRIDGCWCYIYQAQPSVIVGAGFVINYSDTSIERFTIINNNFHWVE